MAKSKSSKGHGFIGKDKKEGYNQKSEFTGSKGKSISGKEGYNQKTGFGGSGNKIK